MWWTQKALVTVSSPGSGPKAPSRTACWSSGTDCGGAEGMAVSFSGVDGRRGRKGVREAGQAVGAAGQPRESGPAGGTTAANAVPVPFGRGRAVHGEAGEHQPVGSVRFRGHGARAARHEPEDAA
ncbi:hypothetical protein GCM10017667_43710 [Streptomyces filamentosus]|uniref:Uncharacterized protein n=1 Tax=Streptomyces filamentosus TaxID=67294 RepID=A0A919BRD0_STRFL|nr:hypothetical protein GCM10017667_43710 [Streptomyces filamentosus]